MTLRRRRSGVARPRPLRAVRRPRVDPPVLDAAPHRVRPHASTTSRTSASGAARTPGPPRARPHRRASRSPPARSARASATPWAWPSPSAPCGPASAPTSSTTAPSASPATATCPRALSHEAASLAGHLGLGRLVCVYDDNHISIDGPTELALTDDAADALRGLRLARRGPRRGGRRPRRPRGGPAPGHGGRGPAVAGRSLRSHIAYPSPTKTDDPAAHGYALKDDEIRGHQGGLGPPGRRDLLRARRRARALPRRRRSRARSEREAWVKRLDAFDGDRAALDACLVGPGSPGWADALPTWEAGEKVATRVASGAVPAGARRRRARPRRRRRRPHRQHRHRAQGPRRAVAATSPAAARSTSAIREHAHGRRHERHGAPRRRAPRRRHVPRVQRLLPAVRSGWPRCRGPRSSTPSPTTRSASARTAPPTSRSSTSPRCGPSPGCG